MDNNELFKGFNLSDRALLRRLNKPWKVQEFVDNEIRYHYGKRRAPLWVLRNKKADCLDAAIFACAVLTYHGYDTFLIDLRAHYEEDHVLCVFKSKGYFGAIGMSKFICLKYRNPVYKTLKELILSYFEGYYTYCGRHVLRQFSEPYYPGKKLSDGKRCKCSCDWLYKDRQMYKIESDLNKIKHFKLYNLKILKDIAPVEPFKFWRETILIPTHCKVGQEYLRFKKKNLRALQIRK